MDEFYRIASEMADKIIEFLAVFNLKPEIFLEVNPKLEQIYDKELISGGYPQLTSPRQAFKTGYCRAFLVADKPLPDRQLTESKWELVMWCIGVWVGTFYPLPILPAILKESYEIGFFIGIHKAFGY